jgi:hypothetical protein
MQRYELKSLVMALLSPSGIGGELNDVSFKNLNRNSERIVSYCEREQEFLDAKKLEATKEMLNGKSIKSKK